MEIQGKIIAVLPMVKGEGKNGEWRLQEYVLETMEQYPRKVCFGLFGDRIDRYPVAIDDVVAVSFDIESREWNGRWFTSIRAWKVDKVQPETAAPIPPMPGNVDSFDAVAGASAVDGDDSSDLPF